MQRIARVAVLIVAVLAPWGCKSGNPEDQLLQQLSAMDKQSIYQQAEDLYAQEEWKDSRKLFSFLYDTFPNDPLGHKAALRVADTYIQYHDTVNLTEARLRYRDFANRYPNDPDRDYALLMLGKTYIARRLRPDRELTDAHEAVKAFQQLVNLYPASQHVEEARTSLAEVQGILAEHEYYVARFYSRIRRWEAVIWRLEYLKENYPNYSRMAEVDELLGAAKETREKLIAKAKERREKEEKKPENADSR